jgi:hypothetical protein
MHSVPERGYRGSTRAGDNRRGPGSHLGRRCGTEVVPGELDGRPAFVAALVGRRRRSLGYSWLSPPSTKSDPIVREEHIALLLFFTVKQLEAASYRMDHLEERIEALEAALEVCEDDDLEAQM